MNACKFCGAKRAETAFHSYMAAYYCGSWHDGSRHWSQGIACRDRCEKIRVQLEGTIETLRKRVAKAIDKAQRSTRFGLEPNSDDEPSEDIVCVFARDMDRVIEILEGKQ